MVTDQALDLEMPQEVAGEPYFRMGSVAASERHSLTPKRQPTQRTPTDNGGRFWNLKTLYRTRADLMGHRRMVCPAVFKSVCGALLRRPRWYLRCPCADTFAFPEADWRRLYQQEADRVGDQPGHELHVDWDPRETRYSPSDILPETVVAEIVEGAGGATYDTMVGRLGGVDGTVIDQIGQRHKVSMRKWQMSDHSRLRFAVSVRYQIREDKRHLLDDECPR